jgi:hypothetical protein
MVYLKAFLFGSIGLVLAVVLRVAGLAVSARDVRTGDIRVVVSFELLRDPFFLVLAVSCVGLGVYLAMR